MRQLLELLALTTLITAFAILPAHADWADDDTSGGEDDDAADDDADDECTVDNQEDEDTDCFDCVAQGGDADYCESKHGDSAYEFVCSRDVEGERIEVWCGEDANDGSAPGCAYLLSPRVPTMAIPVLLTGLFTLLVLAWRRED
jgi:hypothetical protein